MPLSEFELIRRYFAFPSDRSDVVLGIGDDAAVLRVPPGMELVVAMDTLVAGVHFPPETAPADIGHKALAVNLSDLAAMGAEPAWATLALTLPQADEPWVAAFAQGFLGLAHAHDMALIGGDTTRGPLTVTVQAHGFVPSSQALRRAGARAGDLIYVTGTPGDAALALECWRGHVALDDEAYEYAARRLARPEPRIRAGLSLRGLANAAIDVSDGLLQDLGHILAASGLGADIEVDRLPLSEALSSAQGVDALSLALAGGDDYELCFTLAPARRAQLERSAAGWGHLCTCIGTVTDAPGLRCRRADGSEYRPRAQGYDHFRPES